ncbi:MAG: M15 family metallopeptidase [Coriobacteriia bacterium]|nr:M15 family metallopeptidase [Coriobacteriia bacterium]MBS5477296.1 M15 family metallopeptidase [Coriobacteriia bacterium]
MGEAYVQETTQSADAGSHDASGFVLVSDVVPDAIQEIRYFSTYNFLGRRVAGYEQPVALMTREAAEALRVASDEFVARDYRIKLFDTYRPQRAVNDFISWARDLDDVAMKPVFYPDVPKDELFERGYIAARSAHSRGSCADMTLLDMATGREVDMGSPFDFFGPISHADYADLSPEQLTNRALLRDVMVASGFEPYHEEWWHFTLADEPYPETHFDIPVSVASVGR